MRPRDYFEKHVWMGGSLMKRYEAEMRHEIGIDKLMWGADYPHLEGAAPVHRETLRYIFGGLPEDDLRRILGANAVDLWGFDGDLLQSVADRVGPTVADLAEPVALADIEDTFSWSLARPVPLMAGARLPPFLSLPRLIRLFVASDSVRPCRPPRRRCRNGSGSRRAAALPEERSPRRQDVSAGIQIVAL